MVDIKSTMIFSGNANKPLAKLVAKNLGTTLGKATVKTFSDGEISEMILSNFDLRPYSIEKLFDLRKPIYLETAAYGHMGREPQKVKKTFINSEKKLVEFNLELFNWEKLDYVEKIKKLFKLAK